MLGRNDLITVLITDKNFPERRAIAASLQLCEGKKPLQERE